jgi:hypothetical protein
MCRRRTASARPVRLLGTSATFRPARRPPAAPARRAAGTGYLLRGHPPGDSGRTRQGKQPHALLFLHGFNVTFTDAAIRAAQIGYDLKVLGATAFFSWPSRGSVAAYPVDEASIEASERAITDFLVNFTVHCGAEKVHLIAHSMGNCGLLRALLRIAAQAPGQVKFGQVFLAALRILPTLHRGSWHRHGGRAGFDIDLLGHAYFAQAEAWLHDIHDLMRHNEAPAQRQRITPAVHEGTAFWRLRR